jgi:hypothetical protein
MTEMNSICRLVDNFAIFESSPSISSFVQAMILVMQIVSVPFPDSRTLLCYFPSGEAHLTSQMRSHPNTPQAHLGCASKIFLEILT